MKFPVAAPHVFTAFLLLASGVTYAQSPVAVGTAKSKADDAWASLGVLRTLGRDGAAVIVARVDAAPAPVTPPAGGTTAARVVPVLTLTPLPQTGPKSAQTLKVEKEVKARGFRQAAKAFYTKYPAHPQAVAAKKLEALAGLDGIIAGDTAHERAARAVATSFRTDKNFPPADRFEVAHAMEGRDVAKKLFGAPWCSHPIEGEKMADRLHAEFGELPEFYGTLLALAEHTNCDNSRDVAIRILQSPAPASIKVAARRLLERNALIRQPLDFPLTTDKGRATTLGSLAGKLTVVCLWDGKRHPEGPPGLQDYKKNPRPNTSWIYVSVGALGDLPKGAKPRSLPPGTTCVESLGFRSPLAAQLRLTRLPWVLVLDEQKKLSAYGGLDELPSLLTGLNRLIAP